jgi:hypothetical protein
MSGIFGFSATGKASAPAGVNPRNVDRGWAAWIDFAGCMLMLLGFFHLINGFAAIFHDEIYLVGKSGLAISVNYTVWGWVHIVGGVIAIFAGVALQRGRTWARVVAVLVAFASALVNMAFLPAYPIWSAILIAVDILIIWAVIVHGAVMEEPEPLP